MTKKEIIALAVKVREKQATREEEEMFFTELKEHIGILNDYVSSLPKKT